MELELEKLEELVEPDDDDSALEEPALVELDSLREEEELSIPLVLD